MRFFLQSFEILSPYLGIFFPYISLILYRFLHSFFLHTWVQDCYILLFDSSILHHKSLNKNSSPSNRPSCRGLKLFNITNSYGKRTCTVFIGLANFCGFALDILRSYLEKVRAKPIFWLFKNIGRICS